MEQSALDFINSFFGPKAEVEAEDEAEAEAEDAADSPAAA